MTPALARCLDTHRRLCEELGRAPTAREMSEQLDGIKKESVRRFIERLAVEGYCVTLSLETCQSWKNGITLVHGETRHQCGREREMANTIKLLARCREFLCENLLLDKWQRATRRALREDLDRRLDDPTT